MSYYFLYQKKGIPSWLAYLFILIVTVGISLGFKNSSTKIISRADKNLVPQKITVTNLTNESATIHFTTKAQSKTYLSLSSADQTSNVVFDYRDSKKQTSRHIHYFQLSQLKKNTNYSVEIFVENKPHSAKVKFKTSNFLYPSSSNAPIFGKVVMSDMQPTEGALITAKIPDNSPYSYSGLSKSAGEWIITLPLILDSQEEEINLGKDQVIKLDIINENLEKSQVIVKYGDCQPLRTVVLGQNYDFTKSDLVLGVKKRVSSKLVTNPTEGAVISSFYPTFRGQGPKNTFLKLIIEPNIANLLISIDKNGNWQYTPQKSLAPGKYRLLAKSGSLKEEVNFQIGKSGQAVLGDATASATITLAPTETEPDEDPTPTAVSPTSTPQVSTAPTDIPLISPTITQEIIPQLGLNNNLVILLASGLSLLGLFLVLY